MRNLLLAVPCQVCVASFALLMACQQAPPLAPDTSFVKLYGGEYEQLGASMLPRPDSAGYALLGASSAWQEGSNMDLLLILTDAQGHAYTLSPVDVEESQEIAADLLSTESAYILTGTTTDSDGQSDAILAMMTWEGEVTWIRTYGAPDANEEVSAAALMPDGGMILVGTTTEIDVRKDGYELGMAGVEADSTDFWISRLSAQGDVIWTAIHGFKGVDRAEDVLLVDDEIYVLGTTDFPQDNEPTAVFRDNDVCLMRWTSEGGLAATRVYGADGVDEIAASMTMTDQDQLVCVGAVDSLNGSPQSAFWLLVDLSLRQQAVEYISLDANLTPHHVSALPGGHALITGTKRPPISGGLGNIWVVETDAFGTLLWEHNYGSLVDEDTGQEARLDPAGDGLLILGTVGFGTTPLMTLLKTNRQGRLDL